MSVTAILIQPDLGPSSPHSPRVRPNTVHPWVWMAEHRAYVWQGRELSVEECNRVSAKIGEEFSKKFGIRNVEVRLIELGEPPTIDINAQRDGAAKARAVLAAKRAAAKAEKELQPA